jgi:hypothetical protein
LILHIRLYFYLTIVQALVAEHVFSSLMVMMLLRHRLHPLQTSIMRTAWACRFPTSCGGIVLACFIHFVTLCDSHAHARVMTHNYRGCIVVLSINKSVEPNEEQKVLTSGFDQ